LPPKKKKKTARVIWLWKTNSKATPKKKEAAGDNEPTISREQETQ
jgi:hypothetical protein